MIVFVHTGKGNCTGSTVELAFNYVADITAKKKGGMYNINDVPYSDDIDTVGTCHDATKDKVPTVGIEGWSQLPTNNYQATMNAVAKVCVLNANVNLCAVLDSFRCARYLYTNEPSAIRFYLSFRLGQSSLELMHITGDSMKRVFSRTVMMLQQSIMLSSWLDTELTRTLAKSITKLGIVGDQILERMGSLESAGMMMMTNDAILIMIP